jgi:hypothetical protein
MRFLSYKKKGGKKMKNYKVNSRKKQIRVKWFFSMLIVICFSITIHALDYEIVDTGQSKFFNNMNEIESPEIGEPFYGQDANHTINEPSYTDNGDGTITDSVTGLMWSKTCDTNGDGNIDYADKMSYDEMIVSNSNVNFGGYSDWRIPTIKELYSLILFSGKDCSGWTGSTANLVPFIDTDYFDFDYGDVSAGERIIDAQFATSTLYVGTTMDGEETMFGVNFADGRIKGYGLTTSFSGLEKKFYVYYVRGNEDYGINSFEDNGNNTISDETTGLMWDKNDSETGLNWKDALNWVQENNNETYNGFSDWRLPTVKELQSIVDYSRCPSETNSAAINPIFHCSTIEDEGGNINYPFYWSSTTHENLQGGSYAAYVSFGEALGWMERPPGSGSYTLMDVHGAGAQRSDPKDGNPDDYPYGHGPQGDVIRIFNYVRLVRNIEPLTESGNEELQGLLNPNSIQLLDNFPNPFNPFTKIRFAVEESRNAKVTIFNSKGQKVTTAFSGMVEANSYYETIWNGTDEQSMEVSSGVYLYRLDIGDDSRFQKMLLIK